MKVLIGIGVIIVDAIVAKAALMAAHPGARAVVHGHAAHGRTNMYLVAAVVAILSVAAFYFLLRRKPAKQEQRSAPRAYSPFGGPR